MKIRTGFISNSSSSSFIILLDELPKSIEELEEFLFGKFDKEHACIPYYDSMISKRTASEIIFKDLQEYKFDEEEIRRDLYCILYDVTYFDKYENDRSDTFGALLEIMCKDEQLKSSHTFLFEGIEKDIEGFKQMRKEFDIKNDEYFDLFHTLKEDERKTNKKLQASLEEHHKRNDIQYKEEQRLIQLMYDNFTKYKKDKKVIRLKYSDSDGERFSVLEHSNALASFKPIKISHH